MSRMLMTSAQTCGPKDLRTWIAELEAAGELIRIDKPANPLTELPVHVAGQRDAGPVIGSGLMVTKDPDTGQRNVSFHRLQIKGPNKSGILLVPRHTWRNYLKYEARNEPMPVAIFVGHHPLY